jgi:hypothetical protein
MTFTLADEDKQYYDRLMQLYEKHLRATGKIVWLDSGFYFNFADWIKDNYGVWVERAGSLTFENEHDCTLFLLKIQ